MSLHTNRVAISGNTTSSVKYLRRGDQKIAVAEVSVAVNRPQNSDGESVADFLDVVAFEELADELREISKGSAVRVEGRLRQSKWKDAEEKTRSRVKIVAKRIFVFKQLKSDETND